MNKYDVAKLLPKCNQNAYNIYQGKHVRDIDTSLIKLVLKSYIYQILMSLNLMVHMKNSKN